MAQTLPNFDKTLANHRRLTISFQNDSDSKAAAAAKNRGQSLQFFNPYKILRNAQVNFSVPDFEPNHRYPLVV